MESWVAFEPFRHDMPIKGFTYFGVSGRQEAHELLMPRDDRRAPGQPTMARARPHLKETIGRGDRAVNKNFARAGESRQ
jgi:hypothetical protein